MSTWWAKLCSSTSCTSDAYSNITLTSGVFLGYLSAGQGYLAYIFASAIIVLARLLTAVRGIWRGVEPSAQQRVYFANHVSHGDFVLIWTVLPPALRRRTRPVAGADYWLKTRGRRFIGQQVFNAVLIERNPKTRKDHPIEKLAKILDTGASLILFPEGTRNVTDQPLLPFKNGLHHLAKARPAVDLVPVWIDNLNRVMPKGELVPIPLICTVTFGAPIHFDAEETREDFASRAETALLQLRPNTAGDEP